MVRPHYMRVVYRKQTQEVENFSNRWLNMSVGEKKAELLDNALDNLLEKDQIYERSKTADSQ